MLVKRGCILVECDQNQKAHREIMGELFYTGKRYSDNFREKNPVIARVLEGIGEIVKNCWILCNYNYMSEGSPYQISERLFSLPVDEEIYGIINESGAIRNIFGNLFIERIEINSSIPIPNDLKRYHDDRGVILRGTTTFHKGDFVLWLPMSDLEMSYIWKGEEKRVIRVHESAICGILKK